MISGFVGEFADQAAASRMTMVRKTETASGFRVNCVLFTVVGLVLYVLCWLLVGYCCCFFCSLLLVLMFFCSDWLLLSLDP